MKRLSSLPSLLRVSAPRMPASRVFRHGGHFGAGWISGVSIMTAGPVDTHGVWADDEFLQSVHDAIAAAPHGVKSRFTHPTLSDDGLGRMLGRVRDVRRDAQHVFADLHFVASAHDTPDGDLADYVMRLAEESPDAFGMSIVFEHDAAAEDAFRQQHLDESGEFRSPDKRNKTNLPHIRLARLRAADVVDEPAANPRGLFHASALGGRVLHYLDWLAGLDQREPESFGNIAPVRVRRALRRWLELRRARIVFGESPMNRDVLDPGVVRDMLDAFGEQGIRWLLDGKTKEECEVLHLRQQLEQSNAALEELRRECECLRKQLSAVQLGASEGASFQAERVVSPARELNGLSQSLQRYIENVRFSTE